MRIMLTLKAASFCLPSGKGSFQFCKGDNRGRRGDGFICVCCDPKWKEQALQLFY